MERKKNTKMETNNIENNRKRKIGNNFFILFISLILVFLILSHLAMAQKFEDLPVSWSVSQLASKEGKFKLELPKQYKFTESKLNRLSVHPKFSYGREASRITGGGNGGELYRGMKLDKRSLSYAVKNGLEPKFTMNKNKIYMTYDPKEAIHFGFKADNPALSGKKFHVAIFSIDGDKIKINREGVMGYPYTKERILPSAIKNIWVLDGKNKRLETLGNALEKSSRVAGKASQKMELSKVNIKKFSGSGGTVLKAVPYIGAISDIVSIAANEKENQRMREKCKKEPNSEECKIRERDEQLINTCLRSSDPSCIQKLMLGTYSESDLSA